MSLGAIVGRMRRQYRLPAATRPVTDRTSVSTQIDGSLPSRSPGGIYLFNVLSSESVRLALFIGSSSFLLNGLHHLGDLGSNVSTLDQSTIHLLDSLLSLARILKVNETEALGRDSPVVASPEGPDSDLGLFDLNGKIVENGGKSGVVDREREIGDKNGGLCLMLVLRQRLHAIKSTYLGVLFGDLELLHSRLPGLPRLGSLLLLRSLTSLVTSLRINPSLGGVFLVLMSFVVTLSGLASLGLLHDIVNKHIKMPIENLTYPGPRLLGFRSRLLGLTLLLTLSSLDLTLGGTSNNGFSLLLGIPRLPGLLALLNPSFTVDSSLLFRFAVLDNHRPAVEF